MIHEGNKITFDDGYSFYETLHGPMVLNPCDWCGKDTLEAEYRSRQEKKDPPENLCGTCLRRKWGLD